jgi:hypothetical protein
VTRLPTESWDIRPRTDLEPYELNETCALCGGTPVEDHHIFRSSFLIDREVFWVELPDGAVVPHRVGLCNEHHRLVTENRARIVLEADKTYVYYIPADGFTAVIHVGPLAKGKKCSKCKGAGVEPPAPEKKEPARKKAVLGVRVPKDEKEDGYEILVDLIDQYRDKVKDELGWKDDVPVYYVLVAALVQGLQ